MGTSLRDLIGQAKQPSPAQGGGLSSLIQQAKQPVPSTLDRWKDVGRGLANTAAGLMTAPGEGLARVAGALLPNEYGGQASRDAADQLKAQREGAAQTVGPYQTGTGTVTQVIGNLATAVAGGDPIQTAAAAASPDASTLQALGDLSRWMSEGHGDTEEKVADYLTKMAQSPIKRAAFEYAVGRVSAGIASKVAQKLKGKAGLAKSAAGEPVLPQFADAPENLRVPPAAGPPGDMAGPNRRVFPPDVPAPSEIPTSLQAAIKQAKAADAADLAKRTEALGQARPLTPEIPTIRTADVPDPRLVGQGVPRRPNEATVNGLVQAAPTGTGGSSMAQPFLVARAPKGKVPVGTRQETEQAVQSFLRGENLEASRALRNAQAQGVLQTEQAAATQRSALLDARSQSLGQASRQSSGDAARLLGRRMPSRPPSNVQRGGIMGPGRANFFPGGPALHAALQSPATSAGIGAAIGATQNDEDRLDGALVGAAAGLGVGIAYKGITNYRAAKASLAAPSMRGAPPNVRAAYGVVSAAIDRGGQQELAAIAKAKGPWAVRFRKWADAIADSQRPIDRMSTQAVAKGLAHADSPSVALNKALDFDTTLHRFFYDKAIDPMTGQASGPSFRDVMEPLGGKVGAIQDAWTYTVAKRIVDRGADQFAGPAHQFQSYVDTVQWLAQHPENTAFVDRLNQYVDGIGRYAVASGLWTADQWTTMRQADVVYTPFRDLETRIAHGMAIKPGAPTGLNIGKGVPRYGNPNPDFTIVDPAKSLLEYTSRIIRRADQARVNRALFDAADALGLEGEAILTTLPKGKWDPKALTADNAEQALQASGLSPEMAGALAQLHTPTISGSNPVITAVDRSGKTRSALVNAPELMAALSAMRSTVGTSLDPTTMKVLAFPRRIATLAATGWNPKFFLAKNWMMDTPDAAMKVPGMRPKDFATGFAASMRQAMYTHLQEVAPSLAQSLGPSALADEASRFGLSNTSLFSNALTPEAVTRQLSPASAGDVARSGIRRAAEEPLKFFESTAAAVDMGPKLAAYNALTRQLKQQGVAVIDRASGAAATAARSTVDYRRASSVPALQLIYAVVPFARASTLATKRFASFAKQYPQRAAAAASAATLLGMMEWATAKDNPDLTDRPATERMQGPEFQVGDLTVQVPLSPELNAIRASAYWAANRLTQEDPQAGKLLKESWLRALPPGLGDFAATRDPVSLIPIPGAQALLENHANQTVFGQRPVTPTYMEKLDPSMQRFPTTNPTYDAVASGLRKTGIAPKANPLEVENVLRDLTGGFTPGVLALTDPVARAVTGTSSKARVPNRARDASLNPLSAVVKQRVPNRTESSDDYYAYRTKLQTANTSARAAFSAGGEDPNNPAFQSFVQANRALLQPDAQQIPALVDGAAAELRDQEEQVRMGYGNGTLTERQAQDALDGIRQQRQQLLRLAATKLRALLTPP